jgi:tRNA A37 N6-isopentenylltransferase MiaA
MRSVCEYLRKNGASDAETVGVAMWPHLEGRVSMNGGPSHAAVAATYLLKRMAKRKLVWFQHQSRRWHALKQPDSSPAE